MYLCAGGPTWGKVGQLFARLVLPFRSWPWKAGRFLEDAVPREEKEVLAEELLNLCEHREPFVKFYKHGLVTVDVL